MNATYFVLVAALLTFATGFIVASIIWSIKWLLTPREERVKSSESVHFLHIFLRRDLSRKFALQNYGNKSDLPIDESAVNNELYQYHYGSN